MAKLIFSLDGVVVRQELLTQDRCKIGRRPYNDIVLDDLTVSGEHAAIEISADSVIIEDLGSTNGILVNGQPVQRQALSDGDAVGIGKYEAVFREAGEARDTPVASAAGEPSAAGAEAADSDSSIDRISSVQTSVGAPMARLRILSGSSAGREMLLSKHVTTFGKRGISVAAVTLTEQGYSLSHIQGKHVPRVNDVSVADGPIVLQNRDQITMGGAHLVYLDS